MTALISSASSGSDRPDTFLRVTRSARGFRWVRRLETERENLALAIAQTHGVPEILAKILAARGSTVDTAANEISPTIRALMPDPSALRDMDVAAERFAGAIHSAEKIAIFGDYDVDGAASVALIRLFLKAHGRDAAFYIPDRQLEGYGPNETAFRQLIDDGAKLILTVDCGTVSYEPIALARNAGADLIVLDHHQAEERLPDAMAVVNPNRLDDISGQGNLAAAGVVFLFLAATARRLREEKYYNDDRPAPDLLVWLDIVALATVCDVVPLKGFNRALVSRGLEVLRMRRNPGLRALADSAGLTSQPTTYHLGFILGPRLNAGGRIGRSDLATRLLACDDENAAAEIAATLERLNAERQAMQEALEEEAVAQADRWLEHEPDAPIVFAHGQGWHKGLVGLAAARLTEQFALPSFVVSWDADGTGSGSARSIAGADVGAAVRSAVNEGCALRGGGHMMAAGFTLERVQLDPFTGHLQDALRNTVSAARAEPELRIDSALMASAAIPDLMDEIETAGPFGAGNPEPRFAFAAHRCKFAKVVGEKHVKCSLSGSDRGRLDAIAFGAAGSPVGDMLLGSDGLPIHVAGHLRRNEWGGRKRIELQISDVADPKKGL
jgi:single-stranded-DNA-specific exonuclease